MGCLYRRLIRPILFTQDSEWIHNQTLAALGWVGKSVVFCDALESLLAPGELPVELFGLTFPNPVGLAAGMDKAAAAVPVWKALGFGFTELGGVTCHAQPGNPSPRMFRAIADEALINRMGFNNPGAEALAQTLTRWKSGGQWPAHPVGINLGKSKVTPLENAAQDYAQSFLALKSYADFFVVNVSSPNTPNLRKLQDKTALDEILSALQSAQRTMSSAGSTERHKPILVKVAPDLSFEAIDEMLEVAESRHIAGIIATNTTITRPESSDESLRSIYSEAGGLSGRPLKTRSTEVIRHIHRQTGGALPVIGVGGIFSADDAWEKIAAGASLIQLYTGLVYEGPGIMKEIVEGLRLKMIAAGVRELSEVVGTAAN